MESFKKVIVVVNGVMWIYEFEDLFLGVWNLGVEDVFDRVDGWVEGKSCDRRRMVGVVGCY